MINEILLNFSIWTIFFILLFIILPIPSKIKVKKSKDFYLFISNLVSFFHATSMIILILILLKDSKFSDGLDKNNETSIFILNITIGYFIYDIIFGIILKTNDIGIFFHHIFVILGILYTYQKGYYANSVLYALFLSELSNPFLILKNNLDYLNSNKIYKTINGICFIFSFLFARIYFIEYILEPFENKASFLFLLIISLLCLLSLNWAVIIIYIFLKTLSDLTKITILNKIILKWKDLQKSKLYLPIINIFLFLYCFRKILRLEFIEWI